MDGMKPFKGDADSDPLASTDDKPPLSAKGSIRRVLELSNPPSGELPRTPPQQSPLQNILINIILPVFVLNWVSGHGSKPWHLGPVWGLSIAVVIPFAYGLCFFVRTRQANLLSIAGMGSVVLTGGITWAAWRADGSVDGSLFVLFAVKESLLPAIIGLCVLLSQLTPTPLIRVFIFNAQVFDIPRIDSALDTRGTRKEFEKTLRNAAFVVAGTFLLSAAVIFFLTLHFLNRVDGTAPNARELYNQALSKQMLWGFIAIGLPSILAAAGILLWLLKRLAHLTGLRRALLLARR